MNKEQFLSIFRDSIQAITDERYFSTERGYQGQLLAELNSKLNIEQIFPGNPIVEQEYQKTLDNHGITIRPDIIIHTPYERRIHENRRAGNLIVIQIKREASNDEAKEDFDKLDLMFEKLDYPLGIFLNINSSNTFFDIYSGDYNGRLCCFAVRLVNNKVVIYESPQGYYRTPHNIS